MNQKLNMQELKLSAMDLDQAELRDISISGIEGVSGNYKMGFNLNTQEEIVPVSKHYKLIQHKEVIDAVADAVSRLHLNAEANIINGGNKAYVDINFKDSKLNIKKGEEFVMGIRIINSYNKSTGIIVAPKLVRLACSNGMVVSKGWVPGFNIMHTSKMVTEIQSEIELLINRMIDGNQKLKELVEKSIADSIEWQSMELILKKLVPAKKRREAIIERIDKGNLTRWELYNAFTNYATHGQQITPNLQAILQRKANKILTTPLALLKHKIKN